MPYTHVMVDCETLSLAGDAALIQIAAAAFDPITGEVGQTFDAFIRDSRGSVCIQTVAWWMQQPAAAVIGAAVAAEYALSERSALIRLAEFLSAAAPEELWCHGGLDFVWLGEAYVRCGFADGAPWSHKIESDTRTLYKRAPGGMPEVPEDPARKHDARYDVERQIKSCVGALRALRENDGRVIGAFPGAQPDFTIPAVYDPSPVGTTLTGAPTPAIVEVDFPPILSRAEGYTEAYANPSPRPEEDERPYGGNAGLSKIVDF